MKRRDFLKGTSVSAGLLLSEAACSPHSEREGEDRTGVADFELDEKSIGELLVSMQEGALTSERITELYLQRIDETNLRGPTLRAILEVNPEALEIARRRDRERREGGARGGLHGIPVVLKDNIDTADQMTTTAGSLALEGSRASRDSFLGKRLREEGAVLLAKANLSEWANFRSERSSSGWSGRGGQCRNPYQLDRNPCGSSSGSGVATSANLCAASIGTETNGSIVCPSNANGIVGFKPTLGLVSRSGIIPIAHSQDTAGPMTRTVADAARLLNALAGPDPSDTASVAAPLADYTTALDAGALRGARIGVCRKHFGFHEAVDRLMEDGLAAMKSSGAELVDPADLPTHGKFGRVSYQVLLYEFKADLNSYLAALPESVGVRSLEDLIRFNEENREREMPFFGQEIFLEAQEKGPLTSEEYLEALAAAKRMAGPEGIDQVMDEHRLDALVAPTGSPAWVTDLVTGDHSLGGSSSPAAVAGYPNITVPLGFVHGLPVGISFFGRAWSEARLLGLAYAFEQVTQARRPPRFLETLPNGT